MTVLREDSFGGAQQQLNLGGRSFGQWMIYLVGSATRRHAGITPVPVNAIGTICLLT